MFSRIVIPVVLPFFAVLSIAQTDKAAGRALNDPYLTSQTYAASAPLGAADSRISIARLREPQKAQQLYNKALRAWTSQKPAEAQRRLEQALKLYPSFPEALTLYGGIQSTLQQWVSAEEKLQSAIQVDPTYSPAYVVLAGLYNAESRFDDARDATERALSAGADTWDVKYETARALIGKQQYESALAISETALRAKHHGSLLHIAKAHALLGLRRYTQAATELRAYIRYRPDGDGSEHARASLTRIQDGVPQ